MPGPFDNKFLSEKDSLVKGLEDLAEYLGDDDAKQVHLPHLNLRQVESESANSECGDMEDPRFGEQLFSNRKYVSREEA